MKLAFFSLLMVICPIGTYYLTLEYLFNGNNTYSAITAALMANVVVVNNLFYISFIIFF
jgi:vacuolar ATPase assembly integral membrane protein VMA21